MPINNGRYVVTGGYRDPNGTIIEERTWVPGADTSTPGNTSAQTSATTRPEFTPAEVYNLQAQGYADRGDTAMADAYSNLANNLGRYSRFANNTLTGYDDLLNYLQQNERGLQNVAGKTYNTLVGDIQEQRDYINRMFGPNGELTREVNTYYDDLGNYLATEAGRQAANIAAQGIHSGASLGAIRAQQNEAYNETFGRYIQAKEQQINAKQQIASNLINYMSALRQEYGDTTNQYIIDLYKRANDMYNQVAASARQDLNQYNQLLATSISGGGSNNEETYTYNIYGDLVDSNGNVVKKREQIYGPTINNPYINATTNAGKATYGLDNITKPYTVG